MSSRRQGASRGGSNRRQALEEIRKLREGAIVEPKSRLAEYTAQEESLFQEVTEQEYAEIVRKRREELPFVENDAGELGYYDDGEEQFFESDEEGDAQDAGAYAEDDKTTKKRSAGALSSAYIRRAKKLQRAKLGSGGEQKITKMFFSAGNSGVKNTSASAGNNQRSNVKRDIDLDSMLDDLTSNPTESFETYARPASYSSMASRPKSRSLPASSMTRPVSHVVIQDAEEDEDVEFDNGYEPTEQEENQEDVEMRDAAQDFHEQAEADQDDKEEQQEETEVKKEPVLSKRELLLQKAREARLKTSEPTARALTSTSVKKEKEEERSTSSMKAPMPIGTMSHVPSNEVSEWWQVNGGGNCNADATTTEAAATKPEAETTEVQCTSSDSSSLQMYWIDAVEVRDRPGKLYLIGKVKTSSNGGPNGTPTYKSCCVVVHNLQRYLYFVPKLSQQQEQEQDGWLTLKDLSQEKQQQQWMKMHDEVFRLLVPSCITQKKDQDMFQSKLVERNYAFELADIPRGKNLYLKVKYPARYPSPPVDICQQGGQTFQRICGGVTRPLENFLIKRKLLGPGWIEIQNVRKSMEQVSFCGLEYETFDPKNISTLAGSGFLAPPLTVMSLSLKTFCNPQTQKHEILALSAITEKQVSSDGNSNQKTRRVINHFTAMRPLENSFGHHGFPENYIQAARSDVRFHGPKSQDMLRLEANERALLMYFLTRIQLEDPDVIVGHSLHQYLLNVLVTRIDHYKLGGLWSKMTRLRRGRLQPMNMGEGWHEYRMDDLINGRLFCDTYVSSKELLPSQSMYSLTHLVQFLLKKQRLEVEMNDLPNILMSGPQNFVNLLRHTLDDAMFVLQVMHQLEVLPLSKQLAGLCGYLWSRTLEANKRAERIEYLLLHEFSRSKNKFIVPEKFRSLTTTLNSKKKENSYAGGMVFAPKKGLYDNFVVLLDFNSLYPSIIREYNICFTTVERQLMSNEKNGSMNNKNTSTKKQKKSSFNTNNKQQVVDAEQEEENNQDHVMEEEEDQVHHHQNDQEFIPALPSSSCDEGILPGVIKRLIESRKQVKQQLKVETKAGHTEKAKQLDIRQKAIKLTANSMYGCLGFRFSRFYAKPIAALITSTGRQTLQRAKEVAEQECGYDVIYGDTDSIMVDSRSDVLIDAKRIGREIQLQCNKHFKLLELEVDYIFKAILLLNKKKYAALVVKEDVNNPQHVQIEKEVKGLDMVRRDWCVISKVIGNDILDMILSGKPRDEVVEEIHEHLEQIAQKMRDGKEPLEQFVITKSLNKAPEQYPDKAKQYHVQVALALKQQGKPIGAGSHIPYVICQEEDPTSGRKAYHPEEVKRSNGKLHIDIEWYLEAQIHPPVNRLCAHIEGTSSPQLAHCLGLDTSKFSHTNHSGYAGGENDENDFIPSVLQDDADRFKKCLPLEIVCKKCQQKQEFPGAYYQSSTPIATGRNTTNTITSGLCCTSAECRADLWGYDQEGLYGEVGDDLVALLSNRLHLAMRQATKKYYEGWVVCSDDTCKIRTQKQSLRGNGDICSAPGCRAKVSMEFSDQMLYTQLKYFESLFDLERAQRKWKDQQARVLAASGASSASTQQLEAPPLPEKHRQILQKLHEQVHKSVAQNDYNWIKPSIWRTLFT